MWAILGGLLSGLWSAIGNFLTSLIQRQDEQALGEQTQARADEAAQVVAANDTERKVADVVSAENASLAKSAADPGSVRQPDPDSRD